MMRTIHLHKTIALAVCLILSALSVSAQEEDLRFKSVSSAFVFATGPTNILDTYLSSQEYTGTDIRFIYHTKRHWNDRKWITDILHQGVFTAAELRQSGSGEEAGGLYNLRYGMKRETKLLDALTVQYGAMGDLTVGALYNTRNSNNPVQARFALNIGPMASASYSFRVWKKALMAHLDLSMPLCGIMFSPNYGQSYYEIFSRGNYDHNIKPTTVVATPSILSMLSIDIPIGKTAVRVGYMTDIRQAKLNGLRQHFYSHLLMLGYVHNFNLFPKKYGAQ